ncbi:MAG: 5'-methylthioadenosine phosphorylase [Candidatus Poriferisodalaceae bacterium]|jgi:5'-methylthioadenosine phosphorylase
MIAIIAGTGFYDIPGLMGRDTLEVSTPYGSVELTTGMLNGEQIVFLPRHGGDHSIPPAAINYRANLAALKSAGVDAIFAIAVVGSLVPDKGPGSMFVIDDFLDFTTGRADTFHDAPGDVQHFDMTTAYDKDLRALLLHAAEVEAIEVVPTGTYVTTNGPRFETPAEIRMYRQMGAHVVGMTGYPEVALARELSIPYAGVSVVSNLGAGMFDGEISHEEVGEALVASKEPLFRLLTRALQLRSTGSC